MVLHSMILYSQGITESLPQADILNCAVWAFSLEFMDVFCRLHQAQLDAGLRC